MTFIAPHYWRKRKHSFLSFLKKDLYLVKTPGWLKKLFPGCVWDIPVKDQSIFLSFDDGPHPAITPFVLDELDKYGARATFFCIGDNVKKFPLVYQRLLDQGHTVGNHTMHHINGWKTTDEAYIGDIREAAMSIRSSLFRPPYGRIKRSQVKKIASMDPPFETIMWDVLAGDWESSLSNEKCLNQVMKNIRPGSIIVFHDSEKAWERMSYCLPRLLKTCSDLGYRFLAIPAEQSNCKL